MSNTHLLTLRVRRERADTQPTHSCMAANLRHWVVAHRLTARRGWLVDNRTQEWVSERLANIHPRAAKKPLWILPRVTAPSRSVGRLSAGHHRLILPLCELRLNAPLQHRSHRPNVTTTARTKSNILQREPLELFIRLLPLLKSPVGNVTYNHDLQGWRHFIQSTLANQAMLWLWQHYQAPSVYRSQIGVPSLVSSKRKTTQEKLTSLQPAHRAVGPRFRIYTKSEKTALSALQLLLEITYIEIIPKNKKKANTNLPFVYRQNNALFRLRSCWRE